MLSYSLKKRNLTIFLVVELRNKIVAPTNSRQAQMNVINELTGALKNLFALREAYPDLKANQNFMML